LKERQTWLAVLLVVAVGLNAVAFLSYWSGDNAIVLVRWYNQIIAEGFSRPIGNYSPPYLYLLSALTPFDGLMPDMALIKALSVLGMIWLAFASYRLLKNHSAYPELGLATLVLPSVVLNASALGQADTFWVASCVFGFGGGAQARLPLGCDLERPRIRIQGSGGVFRSFCCPALLDLPRSASPVGDPSCTLRTGVPPGLAGWLACLGLGYDLFAPSPMAARRSCVHQQWRELVDLDRLNRARRRCWVLLDRLCCGNRSNFCLLASRVLRFAADFNDCCRAQQRQSPLPASWDA
jgi:hypothetical protein